MSDTPTKYAHGQGRSLQPVNLTGLLASIGDGKTAADVAEIRYTLKSDLKQSDANGALSADWLASGEGSGDNDNMAFDTDTAIVTPAITASDFDRIGVDTIYFWTLGVIVSGDTTRYEHDEYADGTRRIQFVQRGTDAT